MIFDSHAHYDDKQFDEDREAVFAQLKEVGVERVVNISNGWDDMLRSLKLVEQYPFLYGTVGIHPCKVSDSERREDVEAAGTLPQREDRCRGRDRSGLLLDE